MDFILEEWKEDHIAGVAKYANNEKIAGRLRDSFPYPYTEAVSYTHLDVYKRQVYYC